MPEGLMACGPRDKLRYSRAFYDLFQKQLEPPYRRYALFPVGIYGTGLEPFQKQLEFSNQGIMHHFL